MRDVRNGSLAARRERVETGRCALVGQEPFNGTETGFGKSQWLGTAAFDQPIGRTPLSSGLPYEMFISPVRV